MENQDWWSETEYVVVRQVTDGVPAYEVKNEVGNVKTVHRNWLFLVAIPMEVSCPWEWACQFQRKTLLEPPMQNIPCFWVESDSPGGSVDGADTLSPTSRVLLGWVGGVLRPLPSVAPRPTMWRGLGAGDGVWSQSNEEVH